MGVCSDYLIRVGVVRPWVGIPRSTKRVFCLLYIIIKVLRAYIYMPINYIQRSLLANNSSTQTTSITIDHSHVHVHVYTLSIASRN